jgi:hypothetical protein
VGSAGFGLNPALGLRSTWRQDARHLAERPAVFLEELEQRRIERQPLLGIGERMLHAAPQSKA